VCLRPYGWGWRPRRPAVMSLLRTGPLLHFYLFPMLSNSGRLIVIESRTAIVATVLHKLECGTTEMLSRTASPLAEAFARPSASQSAVK
jgi:hypothetical protein